MELGHTPTGDDAFQTAKRLVRETIPKRKKIITASVLCMVGVSVFPAALAYTTKLIVNDVLLWNFNGFYNDFLLSIHDFHSCPHVSINFQRCSMDFY